jgi:hypothetical protein
VERSEQPLSGGGYMKVTAETIEDLIDWGKVKGLKMDGYKFYKKCLSGRGEIRTTTNNHEGLRKCAENTAGSVRMVAA